MKSAPRQHSYLCLPPRMAGVGLDATAGEKALSATGSSAESIWSILGVEEKLLKIIYFY
jgi:hypothetical protein